MSCDPPQQEQSERALDHVPPNHDYDEVLLKMQRKRHNQYVYEAHDRMLHSTSRFEVRFIQIVKFREIHQNWQQSHKLHIIIQIAWKELTWIAKFYRFAA